MNWSYLQIFIQSMGMEALIIGLYFLIFKKKSALKLIGLVFMLNACTHPIVVFMIMKKGVYLYSILFAESFAWLSEAYVYRKKIVSQWKEALWMSLVANLVSWQMGPWVTLAVMDWFN